VLLDGSHQLGVVGLSLRIRKVYIGNLDGRSMSLLQIVLGDVRGLRRRPDRPSATRHAAFQKLVSEHGYLDSGRQIVVQNCFLLFSLVPLSFMDHGAGIVDHLNAMLPTVFDGRL
jgi:hypothetical protein